MDVTSTIANEIMLASVILNTNNLTKIATEIGYKPMLIINALYAGEDDGKFKYDKKKDLLTISDDVELDAVALSEGNKDLQEQLERFISNINRDEKDMSIEELQIMLGGTPELHIRIVLHQSDKLATYELSQPKDKKSVYTFITLKENLDKKWGTKQFKVEKKK